jgi:type IV pilus assembly protein PilM
LKVTYIDVVPNIAGKLAKWIMINHPADKTYNNIGIIDFGATVTSITILKDGNYFIHKNITSGGDYITSQIADKLNIDFNEAETFKKKNNFFENSLKNNDNLSVRNTIDYLITDFERTIEFYKNRNNHIGVDRIFLIGGGSLLKGLSGYIKEHLNVEVSFLSDELTQGLKNRDILSQYVVYAQAIGATLREE